MARIRSVKPEFFTSETILALSHAARLTFVGLWTHADDAGRARDDTRLLKGALWPLEDQVTHVDIAGHLEEMAMVGLICRYESGGKRYLHVTGWDEHQKIDRASKTKLCPECPRATHGPSPDGPGAADGVLDEPSSRTQRTSDEPSGTGSGSGTGTGNREQGTTTPPVPPRDGPPTAPRPDLAAQARPVSVDTQQVFDAWVASTGRTGRTRLDDHRRRVIQRALRAYPLDDVLDAVAGWQHSPHHRGENDRGTVYNDLALLLRTSGRRNNLEHFRDLERAGPPAAGGLPRGHDRKRQQLHDNDALARAWVQQEHADEHHPQRVAADLQPHQRQLARPADPRGDPGDLVRAAAGVQP